MATTFPQHARRNDPNGHMIVQNMLEFLRDAFDKAMAGVLRGTTSIGGGATSIIVPASLPTTCSVVITPLNNPGSLWWISGRSSSGFTINLAAAAPGGGVTFDWVAKGA